MRKTAPILAWVTLLGACTPVPSSDNGPETMGETGDTTLARFSDGRRVSASVEGEEIELGIEGERLPHEVRVELDGDRYSRHITIVSPKLVIRPDEPRELVLETDRKSGMQVFVRGRGADGEFNELLPFPVEKPANAYWRRFAIAPHVGRFAGSVDRLDDAGTEYPIDGLLDEAYPPEQLEFLVALLPLRPEDDFGSRSYDVELDVSYAGEGGACGFMDERCCELLESDSDRGGSDSIEGYCELSTYCFRGRCEPCPSDRSDAESITVEELCFESGYAR